MLLRSAALENWLGAMGAACPAAVPDQVAIGGQCSECMTGSVVHCNIAIQIIDSQPATDWGTGRMLGCFLGRVQGLQPAKIKPSWLRDARGQRDQIGNVSSARKRVMRFTESNRCSRCCPKLSIRRKRLSSIAPDWMGLKSRTGSGRVSGVAPRPFAHGG